MTRKDLAKIIAGKTNLNRRQAENLVIAFGAVVGDVLSKGERIVYSNFGTFYTVHYPSKVIFHPRLGAAKKMIMLPTNVVKWMPSSNIKEMAKNENVVENATAHGAKKFVTQIQNPSISTGTIPARINEINEFENGNADQNEEVEIPITKTFAGRENTPYVEPDKDPVINKIAPEKEEAEPANIYEELMKDGSKEVATFNGAIRVHKNKARNFLGRIFKKNDSEEDKPKENAPEGKIPSKVSLVDSGVFNKDQGSPSFSQTVGEKRIDNIKTEIKKFNTHHVEDINGTSSENKEPVIEKEALITPFKVETPDISFADLSNMTVSKEILQQIPEKIAKKYKVVPIEEKDSALIVAMVDPEDLEAKELIKKQVKKPIITRLASEDDINFILDQYNGLETEVKEAIETADEEEKKDAVIESKKGSEDLIESASDNAPAARIVTSLLRRAIRDKASDIHIEPSEKEVEVRFRIDGVLEKKISLPLDIEPAVVSRIKILSDLKIDEQRLPQDGRFSINFESRQIDFRISTMPVANGEKIVMRVLDKMTGILTIEQLGIRGSGLETLKNNIEKSHGMTLVTGPTGSGKTTTLYALIDKLYNEGVNIVTLEDPIEYRMPGINQSQVNAEIKYTFASGLRSIVRQDPDIIMIGEIRDKETAEMAVHAALTGHIVLSTLHTNNATGAAPRLMDMGVEPFLLTSALNVVIGQRLARKICEDCKEEIKVPEIEKGKIQAEIDKMPEKERQEIAKKELKFFHGKGCKNCGNSGYKGRIGLYEVFGMSESIKEMILAKKPSSVIQEEAIKNGMVTMLQDGVLKVVDGITSVEEIWRITKD